MDLLILIDLICAMIFGVLALLLAVHSRRHLLQFVLVGACALTATWALAAALLSAQLASMGMGVLEALRTGAWVVFLGMACRAGLLNSDEGSELSRVSVAAVAAVALCLMVVGAEVCGGLPHPIGLAKYIFMARMTGRLLLVTIGLLFVAILMRQRNLEFAWRARYLCLGVGGLLSYELFFCSQALLMQEVDLLQDASQGIVYLFAAPLIVIATAHNPDWSVQLNLSRRAALDSIVLVGVGIYLATLAGAGMLLRSLGEEWGRPLQAGFFLAAIGLLVVFVTSNTTRSSLDKRLSRYLFTHRHDYREQWQHLSESLSSTSLGQNLSERTFSALATIVNCDQGGVWVREGDVFRMVVNRTLPVAAVNEANDGIFMSWLSARNDRILEIKNQESTPKGNQLSWLPGWLYEWEYAWLVIPLVYRKNLKGFVVLGRRPGPALHSEDEELLNTVALHVTSVLAEEQAQRNLEEARQFEAISREMAFVAHDLSNVANELSLTLANARRHIHNPKFRADMLQSMEESIARLKRLLNRVGGRARHGRVILPVDFRQLLGASFRTRFADQPQIHLEMDEATSLPLTGDPDRLVAISGHLIQNAIDATGGKGHVSVRLGRDREMAVLEIEDDGPGMSHEILQQRLREPFGSTKPNGFGLGLYECRITASELGGRLEVESELGRGTIARLRLPLAISSDVYAAAGDVP